VNQFIFLFSILVIGQLTGLLLAKRIPLLYIMVSGFLWGSVEFVVFLLIWLCLGIPYTGLTLWVFIGTTFISLVIWNVKLGSLQILLRKENLQRLFFVWLVFCAVFSFAVNVNMTQATSDSFVYLMNGRSLPYLGFDHPTSFWLGSFGVFIPMLQSASVFLQVGYLEVLQPIIWFSLLGTFLILLVISIEQLTETRNVAWVVAALTTIGLGTINFLVFQMFYLHTNLIEGLFLLNALGCAWLAMVKTERGWLVLSMFSLLGFSLGRVEAPIVALLFLPAMIGSGRFSLRELTLTVAPFLVLSSMWLVVIAVLIGSGTRLLTPLRILVILAGYVGMGLLVGGQRYQWVRKLSTRGIEFVLWGCVILISILFILRSAHMLESVVNLAHNLFVSGRWGITWYIVIILWLFSYWEKNLPQKDIFQFGLPAYFLFILSLVFLRAPYHENWWDSANRMMTHLFPAILFYLSLRYAPGIKHRLTVLAGLDTDREAETMAEG